MRGSEIREALHAGRRVYSSALIAPSWNWHAVVKDSGIDFVFIDTEHVPISRDTLAWMCAAYKAIGIPAVVRIPSPDPFEALKVLDGGASGIIAPYLESIDDAKALAAAVRYRPLKGERLADAIRDPNSLEPELREYLEKRNQDLIFIANIESVPAIRNLEAICAVPGLDAVLIGPHDLSCSLGIPEQYGHPRFDEAVRKIFTTARSKNVGAGIHFWLSLDQELAWARAGGNLVMHSSDLSLFSQNLKKELTHIKGELGE